MPLHGEVSLVLGAIRFLTVLANFRGQLVDDLCPYMGGDTNWGLIKMVVRYGRTAVTWGNWWQGGRRSRMINDGHKYIVGGVGQGGQSRVYSGRCRPGWSVQGFSYLGLSIDF